MIYSPGASQLAMSVAGAIFNASIVIVTMAAAPVIGIRAAALGWLVGATSHAHCGCWLAGLGRPHLEGQPNVCVALKCVWL